MKFLIVGASGFVGSNLSTYLRQDGREVLGTRFSADRPDLVTFDLSQDRIADCLPGSFLESDAPSVAVICACISQIDRCYREREFTRRVNVDNTIRLIQDLEKLEFRIVFLSTSAVFDGSAGYYHESDVRCPVSEYGRQKMAVEQYIESYLPKAIVMRLDKIVSDSPWQLHMLTEWLQCIREKRPIVSIEEQHFSPTFVKDVASAIGASCLESLSGIYHVSNSEFFTRDELARQFVRTLNEQAEFVTKPESEFNFADRRTLKAYMDSTRFVKATDMRFTSMREVFESYKQKLSQDQ